MSVGEDVEAELVKTIPNLRAFARSLVRDPARADDLVQETVVKAWSNMDSYEPGTNMRGWLFTILRNTFYSEYRRTKREVEDVDGEYAAQMTDMPAHDGTLDMRDFLAAFATLPDDQREALTLVGASGFTYEEAAEVCGCAVGTVKSRVNRARVRLAELLEIGEDETVSTSDDALSAIAEKGP